MLPAAGPPVPALAACGWVGAHALGQVAQHALWRWVGGAGGAGFVPFRATDHQDGHRQHRKRARHDEPKRGIAAEGRPAFACGAHHGTPWHAACV